jgi:hypothetical protein
MKNKGLVGKLNKNDIDKIAGNMTFLSVCRRNTDTRQQAMHQVDKHLASYQNWTNTHRKDLRPNSKAAWSAGHPAAYHGGESIKELKRQIK